MRGGLLDWVFDAKWCAPLSHFFVQELRPVELLLRVIVAGSLSWRIPLGLQLLPGILLGLGAFALPASPRLLVLQGRREEALASLAKLRLRSLSEARTDPLIQVRALG
jgi:Sugar (and other) transporter